MSPLSINTTVSLKNGGLMPILGFGVALSNLAVTSTTEALKAGYRLIDTARLYGSEVEVGTAVRDWHASGNTDPVWLTTKINGEEQNGAENEVEAAVEESIARLDTFGLKWDLFLLHDPTAGLEKRLAAYKVLVKKQQAGLIREIGVSNFSEIHLQQLVDAGLPTPSVNQIELHPWNQQRPIVAYCKKAGITVQAFCPMVRGRRMEEPVLKKLTAKTGKSPAAVLIRWSLQKGYVPLPKSDNPARIGMNADVFDFALDNEDMAALDAVDEGAEGACSYNPVAHE